MPPNSAHARFLTRARRRWIAWRTLESTGICACIGAGVGFVIVPILLLRDQSALFVATCLLALGAVLGALWTFTRWPTLLQTAMLIDRQLRLHDLLSTALNPATMIDAAFGPMIGAQADAACQRISPNELIFRRLGSRAWGGIGIASALLLTLAMMSSEPRISAAHVDDCLPFARSIEPASEQPASSVIVNSQPTRASSTNKDSRRAEGADEQSAHDRIFDTSKPSAAVARVDAAGSTAGRTNDASVPRVNATGGDVVDLATNSNGVPGSASAAAHPLPDGQTPSGADAVPSRSTGSNAPWQPGTWPADRAAALEYLHSGQVPDAYRDMIHEYFDPSTR